MDYEVAGQYDIAVRPSAQYGPSAEIGWPLKTLQMYKSVDEAISVIYENGMLFHEVDETYAHDGMKD